VRAVTDSERIAAWDLWLAEVAPGVRLSDEDGRNELAEQLAAAVAIVVPDQPMAYSARERWWRAWLRVEGDREIDLEVGADRERLAAQLARAVPAPYKDAQGRWYVYGERAKR